MYIIYNKYKTIFNTQYKNKLTTILRKPEKEYYKRLQETSRNNLKNMWFAIRSRKNNCKLLT